MMVLVRSTCLVIGLLFISFALRDCVAHALQATETTMVADGNGIAVTRVNAVSVNKELAQGVPAAAVTVNKRLGGRKMVVDKVLRKEVMKEEGLNGGTPKISGQDKNSSKTLLGTSEENLNEISSLIHKDYAVPTLPRKAPIKPPINNHEPLDEKDVKP